MAITADVGSYSIPTPPCRRLRVFALDPSFGIHLQTAAINEATVEIPWEDLAPGPVGEYVEVVDVDPASDACYAPVDLNHPYLLAQDGLKPSEASPQFHQQMVYAVAMSTIGAFKTALGRPPLWSSRLRKSKGRLVEEYVPRLRIYPHALRAANAYYDPGRVALLLGYFPASSADPTIVFPGGTIFACLSHDIVAHETAHALLDGMHRGLGEPTSLDSLALHEAFADIVALFQHFSYPEVLRYQIARSRGNLETQSLLAELAQQFGQALGRHGGLRNYLGGVDPQTGEWKRWQPDRRALRLATEPHDRGAILVAAVFDAFLGIYRHRTADLLRIATGGSGELPPGELHPDLVGRLAEEAAKAAGHVLRMCIRALDYLPPVDVTLGDYLRALITADVDLLKDDRYRYRVAFIEAFFRHGIDPADVRYLSEESLCWEAPAVDQQEDFRDADLLEPRKLRRLIPDWGLTSDRIKIWRSTSRRQAILHSWFSDPTARAACAAARLAVDETAPGSVYRGADGRPSLEVDSVHVAQRVGPDGVRRSDLLVKMTQRRRGYFDPTLQRRVDAGEEVFDPDFVFRGGCTLLVDLETGDVRYCIAKSVLSEARLEAQRRFLLGEA